MTDLRERVARAIYEHACIPGDFIWELLDEQARDHWRPYADAVLAELGLTQAEPVAYVWKGVIGAMRRGQRAIDATLWSMPTGQAGVPLYAAPPRPQASAEDVALVDRYVTAHKSLKTDLQDAWQRIRADYERMGVVK
ncbi:MAG: hypothetical protein ACK5PF_09580 [bacterium]